MTATLLGAVIGEVEGDGGETAPPAPLDPAVVEQPRADYGAAFRSEMIGLFLQDAPEQLKSLAQGLAVGEAEVVRRAAHTLKSNGALFGAAGLVGLCEELENRARAGDLAGAPELVARLEAALAALAAALRDLA